MSTSKTQHNKKCPISRANIIHFETLALYQNVSYKMVRGMRFELTRVAPYAPQTYASTNSATPAARVIIELPRRTIKYFFYVLMPAVGRKPSRPRSRRSG